MGHEAMYIEAESDSKTVDGAAMGVAVGLPRKEEPCTAEEP